MSHWKVVYFSKIHNISKNENPLVNFKKNLIIGAIPPLNTLRPRQDGRHFADDIFRCIFFNANCCILIRFSLKYGRKGPIDNNPALVQLMAWRRSGDKPLSDPMMISLLTHICVTRPQWVKLTKQVWVLCYDWQPGINTLSIAAQCPSVF